MMVTDLHGEWDAYQRYHDRFVDLQAHGYADYVIFTGDLIHRSLLTPDVSLEIVLDILKLRPSSTGAETDDDVTMLKWPSESERRPQMDDQARKSFYESARQISETTNSEDLERLIQRISELGEAPMPA
jgi:Icc-related predicted phosphoesterase